MYLFYPPTPYTPAYIVPEAGAFRWLDHKDPYWNMTTTPQHKARYIPNSPCRQYEGDNWRTSEHNRKQAMNSWGDGSSVDANHKNAKNGGPKDNAHGLNPRGGHHVATSTLLGSIAYLEAENKRLMEERGYDEQQRLAHQVRMLEEGNWYLRHSRKPGW